MVAVQRWNDLDDVPGGLGPTVVTIGNFDGVHRGHQRVLTALVEQARERVAAAVAITFEPHPIAVLYPDRAPAQIVGLDQRLGLLEAAGVDAVLVMRFTHELAAWSPRRFVEDVLVRALHADEVVVGHDTRFGHRNSGDVDTLRELGAEYGFEVLAVEDLGAGAGGVAQRWSSTWVRELLAAGDVATAATVLGRAHRTTGIVVHGDHRGRGLGFPTANLGPDAEGLVPADGVYAGWLVLLDGAPIAGEGPGRRLPAAISVGTNPTFDGHARRVEAYVLDRDDLDLYGRRVGIEFVRLLRPTLRYDGVAALVEQMHRDVDQSREVLGVRGATA
jgi:riboflavin kinase/FMN adenylyltransferase